MTSQLDVPSSVDPLDLVDPGRFARDGYPHDVWAALRAEAPVVYLEPEGYVSFWAVTKYADITDIAAQPERFSSAHGLILGHPGAPAPPSEMVVMLDPPRHGPLRRAAMPRFTPRAIRTRHDEIDRIAVTGAGRPRRLGRRGVRLRRAGRRAAADRGDLLDPRCARRRLEAPLPVDQRGHRQGRPRVPPAGGDPRPDDPPGPGRAARLPGGPDRHAPGRPRRRHRQPADRCRDRR